MSRLPNFIMIGAGKAGTTSLWGYLREHPQVFMSETKELNFFTTEHNWGKGLDWYRSQFADAGDAVAVGEGSGNYTNWPHFQGVPARMAEVLPDARLLYVIREPIERMRSAWRYHRVRGEDSRPIRDALLHDRTYVDVSRYAQQIDQYLEHFDRSQLHVIVSESMRDDRAATMRQVFDFLGVDPDVELPVLDREFNRTDRKLRQARGPLRVLQRVPGYAAARDALPDAVLRTGRRFATRRVLRDEEGQLDDATVEELRAMVRDDVERLRQHLGTTEPLWNWS